MYTSPLIWFHQIVKLIDVIVGCLMLVDVGLMHADVIAEQTSQLRGN